MRKKGLAALLCLVVGLMQVSFVGKVHAASNPTSYVHQMWDDTSGWTTVAGSDAEVSPTGQLHLLSTSSSNSEIYKHTSIPTNFDFEIRVKVDQFGNQNNWRVNTGSMRLFMGLKEDGIYAFTSSGTFTKVYATTLDTGWHTYRAEVRSGTADVYMDGAYVTRFSLQSSSQTNGMHIWTTGPTAAEMHIDYTEVYSENTYFYQDDFEDETAGNTPSHWMSMPGYQNVTGNWQTYTDTGGNKVLAQTATASEYYALLHAYARNLEYQGRFEVASHASDAWIWFVLRWNGANSMIQAGYDYGLGKWVLKERTSEDSAWSNKSINSSLGLSDGWHTFKIAANESTVTLYIDGVSTLSASSMSQLTWGHLGLATNKASAKFDDIHYIGDGRVNDGVYEMLLPDRVGAYYQRNFDLVSKADGSLYGLFNEGTGTTTAMKQITSADHGETWLTPTVHVDASATTLSGGSSPNIIKLNSGKWLEVLNEQGTTANTFKNYTRISTDEGATWSGKNWIQSEWINRVTMPGKIMQSTDGTIFFPSGETGSSQEANGGVQIYYSNDEGVTWTKSRTRHDEATFQLNLQEGRVVQLPAAGHYKSYFRTDQGYLYESVSVDDGVTWGTPVATVFPSPLCAFNIERDGTSNTYYMYWSYNDVSRGTSATTPRFRNALAISTDGTNSWHYVMDVDDWEMDPVRYMNHNIRIIGDYLYLSVSEQDKKSDSNYNGNFKLKFTRVAKAKIQQYANFSPLH